MMTTLRAALVVLGNDLRRRSRNRAFVIQSVVGPVLLAMLISLAFGGEWGFEVTVGVTARDEDPVARGLVDGLVEASSEDLEFVEISPDIDPQDFLDGRDGAAVLVIPPGFAASLATADPEPLEVVRDPEDQIAGGVVMAVAQQLAARIDVGRLATAASTDAGVAAPDPASLADVELPITIGRDDLEDQGPVSGVGPGIGLLFLFLSVGFVARSLIQERTSRVLDRLRAGPVSTTAILLGKCGGLVAVGIVTLGTMWLATSLLLDADWGPPLGVLLLVVASSLAVAGAAGVVAGLARTEQAAEMIATGVAFLFGVLGGSLIPLSDLPESLLRISWATPNGWALHGFAELSAGQGTVVSILPHVGGLLAWALGLGLVAAVLLPRRLSSR